MDQPEEHGYSPGITLPHTCSPWYHIPMTIAEYIDAHTPELLAQIGAALDADSDADLHDVIAKPIALATGCDDYDAIAAALDELTADLY